MSMDNEKCARCCLVAEFSDGTRKRFYAESEEVAFDLITEAAGNHDGLAWYDGVTDENYEKGIYYKYIPDTALHTQGIDLTAKAAGPSDSETIQDIIRLITKPASGSHRPS